MNQRNDPQPALHCSETQMTNIRTCLHFRIWDVFTILMICDQTEPCTVLFNEEMVEDDKSPENNEVKILQRSPEFITLIYPAKALDKLPGIVVLNSRSTKPKCHTCQGKKCMHVNIYSENAFSHEEEEDLPTKWMPRQCPYST